MRVRERLDWMGGNQVLQYLRTAAQGRDAYMVIFSRERLTYRTDASRAYAHSLPWSPVSRSMRVLWFTKRNGGWYAA